MKAFANVSRKALLGGGLFGVLSLLVALSIAWLFLYANDFFYGVWHDHGGIKGGIERYAPENRYKKGFGDTTKQERQAIFHLINVAVHNGGEGLDEIAYETATSRGKQALLRRPEVVHLEDVAHLITLFKPVVLGVIVVWLITCAWSIRVYQALPSLLVQATGVFALCALLFVVLLVFGAENVFNTLHIWIFPKEHQWFFYYQDSLMSTMMLAPVLFGWIGGAWLLTAIIMWLLLAVLSQRVLLWKNVPKR